MTTIRVAEGKTILKQPHDSAVQAVVMVTDVVLQL